VTLQEKLIVVLENLPYTQAQIAQILGINESNISQWKNRGVLKRYHYLALEAAFGVPREVFEDSTIDTPSKIIEYLKERAVNLTSLKIEPQVESKILALLEGSWYFYGYSSVSDKVYENKIMVEKGNIIFKDLKGNIEYRGEILESNSFYTTFILRKKGGVVYMVLNNALLYKNLFYGVFFTKSSFFHQDFFQFVLLSREKVPLEIAKRILGDREKIQLHIPTEFLEKIAKFNSQELEVKKYSDEDFLNYLSLKKRLYIYVNLNSPHSYSLEVENINRVKLYSNNKLYLVGKMRFYRDEILIDFESESGEKIYFLIEKIYKSLMPFSFKAPLFSTDEQVIGVGLISDKELEEDAIEYILGKKEENILNISEVWRKINEVEGFLN